MYFRGLAQNRHAGINFDVALMTNLSEAHIEAHGSAENYKKAKGKLFFALIKHPKKSMLPKKLLGVNLDDVSSDFFSAFMADEKFGVTLQGKKSAAVAKIYSGTMGTIVHGFVLENQEFIVSLPGEFNLYNALLALAAANMLGAPFPVIKQALADVKVIRGRMEQVPNNRGIKIYVDYGCEPVSFRARLLPLIIFRTTKLSTSLVLPAATVILANALYLARSPRSWPMFAL